ncbi:PIR protein [Plasmodium vivax]|uniref:VIR protein n=1 Tax=Plasmodium vivax TaxID=5855 RepID=A0A564ZU70_PLAVI|nr:PIR protein [Plasmodium vivax]
MSCLPKIKDYSYYFFENIDNFGKYSDGIKSSSTSGDITTCCTSFMKGSKALRNNETSKNICENFLKLYKLIPNVNDNKEKNWGFLNYWLNFELSQVNNKICVKDFYDEMESHCDGKFDGLITDDIMYNLKKDDLHKMHLLYSLYKKYTDIDDILGNRTKDDTKLLLSYSTACCRDYLEANYMCKGENDDNNNSQFCAQLKKFKTKYDGLYNTQIAINPEYTNNFKKLSECNNNTVSTAVIGTTVGLVPLLVGLYKFTPLRQLINSNKGKLTQEYRNNDDEMTNIMLMDQQNEHTSSEQGTYNIKYHSA